MQRLSMAAALGAAVVAAGSLIAFAGISNASQHANTAAAPASVSSGWYGAAPYVMPLDNNPPNLPPGHGRHRAEGVRAGLRPAPNGGGCNAGLGRHRRRSPPTPPSPAIIRVRAAGGDVSVSVGGYGGTKLGQDCGTAAATAAAYQQVINKYGLKAIDFDLEEPEYENTTAIDNETRRRADPAAEQPGPLHLGHMPGTAAGTGWFGTQLLDKAKTLGFAPDNYSIMPFDGGFSGAAARSARWRLPLAADEHLRLGLGDRVRPRGLLRHERPDRLRRVLLPGRTSRPCSATRRATAWAGTRSGREPGPAVQPAGQQRHTSGTCSSVPQDDWDFTKYTAQFAGATPPTSPPPTPAARPRPAPARQRRGARARSTPAARGHLQRPHLERQVVDPGRHPGRHRPERVDRQRALLTDLLITSTRTDHKHAHRAFMGVGTGRPARDPIRAVR